MEESRDEHVRVGVLLEDTEISRSLYEAMETMIEEQPVSIDVVAINRTKSAGDPGGSTFLSQLSRVLKSLLRNEPGILIEADFVIANKLGCRDAATLDEWYTREDVTTLFEQFDPEVIDYELRPLDDELGYEVPAEVVGAFADKTDLVISFEHAILKNDILDATKYGVIGYHGGDIRKYRGRPVAIWEFLNDEPEIGRSVQVLTPTLDGGKPVVIKTSELSEYPTLWELKYKQKQMFTTAFAEAVEKFRDPEWEPGPLDPVGELSHSSDKQRWSVVVKTLLKMQKNRLLRMLQ